VIPLDAGNYTAISLSSTFKKSVEDVLNTASLASTVSIKYDRDKQKFQFSILPTTNDNQGRMVIINFKCDTDNTTQTAGTVDLVRSGASISASNFTATVELHRLLPNCRLIRALVELFFMNRRQKSFGVPQRSSFLERRPRKHSGQRRHQKRDSKARS